MNNDELVENNDICFEVKDKLPHNDEMLLISGIAYKAGDELRFSMQVPGSGIFIAPGKKLSPLAMIEMLAQLCGAQHVHEQKLYETGKLRGYLVGIDHVSFQEPVYAGDRLDMTAWKILEMEDVQRVKGKIEKEGRLVGEAELTLFKTDEWMEMPGLVDKRHEFDRNVNGSYKQWAWDRDAVARGILDSLYGVEVKHNESTQAVFFFDPSFIGFSGHFPGYPVLPAVTMIYIGLLLAEMCSNKKLTLYSIQKAKFTGPVYPLDRLDVSLKCVYDNKEKTGRFAVIIHSHGIVTAKYTIGTGPVEE